MLQLCALDGARIVLHEAACCSSVHRVVPAILRPTRDDLLK
jgi:hypothetical protein